MNRKLRLLAILFALSTFSFAAYYFWAMPTTLRVAVGPKDTEQLRYITALAKTLVDNQEPFRLLPVVVDGSPSASAAIDGKKAELAVLRSDDPTSSDARAVAVLQQRAIILIGHADRVKSFSDLAGKRLILVQGATDTIKDLVERVLAHFGLMGSDLQISEATITQAERALVEDSADAIILIAPPAGKGLLNVISRLGKAKIPLSFIELPSAEGVAARFSFLRNVTIPAGVFGGTPPKPLEEINSVAITYELVASKSLPDRTVGALTKTLLAARIRNYPSDGAPFSIVAPPTDEVRRFMVHDGTKAFLDDSMKTLLETYSDHLWLALFGFSLLGSSITTVLVWLGVGKEPESSTMMHAVPALLDRIASAQTLAEIQAIQHDFDAIIDASLRDYVSGVMNEDDVSDQPIWLAQVQRLIQNRTQWLERETPAQTPPGAALS